MRELILHMVSLFIERAGGLLSECLVWSIESIIEPLDMDINAIRKFLNEGLDAWDCKMIMSRDIDKILIYFG